MKKLDSDNIVHPKYKNKIIAVALTAIVALTALISYFGYNAYNYENIADLIYQKNYTEALSKTQGVSPSFRELDKVTVLLNLMIGFDEKISDQDLERLLSRLNALKRFDHEVIDGCYDDFYSTAEAIADERKENEFKAQINELKSKYEAYQSSEAKEDKPIENKNSNIVYYVENSEVYHSDKDCRSLKKANAILSGPIPNGRRLCKICEN